MERVRGYGSDVSKAAIAVAAKHHPEARFMVANTNTLIPLADDRVDVLINIFAPRNGSEFARIVRPGGQLVVVIPGPGHLRELRERFRLLGIEEDKVGKIGTALSGFKHVSTHQIDSLVSLDRTALRDLLEMTPNAFYMDATTRQELSVVSTVQTTVEFAILEFTLI
jgi:23S rRNA (guanine745-N1)-methyltransferase